MRKLFLYASSSKLFSLEEWSDKLSMWEEKIHFDNSLKSLTHTHTRIAELSRISDNDKKFKNVFSFSKLTKLIDVLKQCPLVAIELLSCDIPKSRKEYDSLSQEVIKIMKRLKPLEFKMDRVGRQRVWVVSHTKISKTGRHATASALGYSDKSMKELAQILEELTDSIPRSTQDVISAGKKLTDKAKFTADLDKDSSSLDDNASIFKLSSDPEKWYADKGVKLMTEAALLCMTQVTYTSFSVSGMVRRVSSVYK